MISLIILEVGKIYKGFPIKYFNKGFNLRNWAGRIYIDFFYNICIKGFLLQIGLNEFIRDFFYKIYKGFPL